MGKLQDLTGQRYGMLVVLRRAKNADCKLTRWHVLCDCGTEKDVQAVALKSGATRTCGCTPSQLRHGHARDSTGASPEYRSWRAMLWRCDLKRVTENPRYGGRGIKVCDRWRIFENFLVDMGPRSLGTTIDRYPNNDGNYEPGNCRWATPKQQGENRSTSRFIEHEGETLTLTGWAERFGIAKHLLWSRLKGGWLMGEALTAPPDRARPRMGGEDHPQTHLTDDNVREIRRRQATGERAIDIGKDFGISGPNVIQIARRVTWQHVPDDDGGFRICPINRARGSRAGSAKLTEAQIPGIRKLLAEGTSPYKIAGMYGVSIGAIYPIAKGKAWAHVP